MKAILALLALLPGLCLAEQYSYSFNNPPPEQPRPAYSYRFNTSPPVVIVVPDSFHVKPFVVQPLRPLQPLEWEIRSEFTDD